LYQYGALGVMVLYLLWKDYQLSNRWEQIIDNNTIALNAFLEMTKKKE